MIGAYALRMAPVPVLGAVRSGQGSVLPASSVGPLCIAGSLVVRVPASLQDASAFGTIYHALGTLSVPVVGAFQAGETWNFQAWYRDDVTGKGNLTDAVEVDFH